MSNSGWKYRLSGMDFGPVSYEQVTELVSNGMLGPNDDVCPPDGEWTVASACDGLRVESETASSVPGLDFELPSIAQEKPVPRANAERRRPVAEEVSAPQATATPSAPVSMKASVDSILALADTATSNEQGQQAHLAPQRGVETSKPGSDEPGAGKPSREHQEPEPLAAKKGESLSKQKTRPIENGNIAKALAKEAPAQVPDQAAETQKPSVAETQTPPTSEEAASQSEPTPTPATQPDPTDSPPAAQPAKSPVARPPVNIPSSKKSFDFDTELLGKIAAGVAAAAVLAAAVIFVPPMLSGGGGAAQADVRAASDREIDGFVNRFVQALKADDASQWQRGKGIFAFQLKSLVDEATSRSKSRDAAEAAIGAALVDLLTTKVDPILKSDQWDADGIADIEDAWQRIRSLQDG